MDFDSYHEYKKFPTFFLLLLSLLLLLRLLLQFFFLDGSTPGVSDFMYDDPGNTFFLTVRKEIQHPRC